MCACPKCPTWFCLWVFHLPVHRTTRDRLWRRPLCTTCTASSAACHRLPFLFDRIASGGYRHSEVHGYGAERSAEQGGQLDTYAVRCKLLTRLRHTFGDLQPLGYADHLHNSVQSAQSFGRYAHRHFRRRQRKKPSGDDHGDTQRCGERVAHAYQHTVQCDTRLYGYSPE